MSQTQNTKNPPKLPSFKPHLILLVVLIAGFSIFMKTRKSKDLNLPSGSSTPDIQRELQSEKDRRTLKDSKVLDGESGMAMVRLAQSADPAALKFALNNLKDANSQNRQFIARTLPNYITSPEAAAALKDMLLDSDASVRQAALVGIPGRPNQALSAVLETALASGTPNDSARLPLLLASFRVNMDQVIRTRNIQEIQNILKSGKGDESSLAMALKFLGTAMARDTGYQDLVIASLKSTSPTALKIEAIRLLKTACPASRSEALVDLFQHEVNATVVKVALQESVFHANDKVKQAVSKVKENKKLETDLKNYPFAKLIEALSNPNHPDPCKNPGIGNPMFAGPGARGTGMPPNGPRTGPQGAGGPSMMPPPGGMGFAPNTAARLGPPGSPSNPNMGAAGGARPVMTKRPVPSVVSPPKPQSAPSK